MVDRRAAVLAAVILAGCGGHSVHSVLDGVPAPDVARTAATHLTTEPYHFSATTSIASDASSAVTSNPQVLEQLTRGLDAVSGTSMHGDIETPRRVSVSVMVRTLTMTMVAYDGGAFGSVNGHDYAELPSFETLLGSGAAASTPADISTYLLPASTTVQGRVDRDGVSTERISGDIDPAAFARLLPQQSQAAQAGAGLLGPQAGAAAGAAVRAMTFSGGHIDEYVGLGDGRPVALEMTFAVRLDVAGLLSAVAAGVGPGGAAEVGTGHGAITLNYKVDEDMSGYGSAIHVARPAPDLSQQEFVQQLTAAARGS